MLLWSLELLGVLISPCQSHLQHNLMPQPSTIKSVDDSDELVIEDDTERVVLTGKIPVGTMVTGNYLRIIANES